jgi:hypothetical protein
MDLHKYNRRRIFWIFNGSRTAFLEAAAPSALSSTPHTTNDPNRINELAGPALSGLTASPTEP